MKPIFENEIENPKNKAILSYLNNIKGLSGSEISQLKLIVVWKSIQTFKPEKGCLFSTHLYNMCRYTYLDHMKQKFIPVANFIDKSYENNDNILDQMPKAYKMVLEDRFVYKYTIREMVKIYKLSKKQINILINDSVDFLRKLQNV